MKKTLGLISRLLLKIRLSSNEFANKKTKDYYKFEDWFHHREIKSYKSTKFQIEKEDYF